MIKAVDDCLVVIVGGVTTTAGRVVERLRLTYEIEADISLAYDESAMTNTRSREISGSDTNV